MFLYVKIPEVPLTVSYKVSVQYMVMCSFFGSLKQFFSMKIWKPYQFYVRVCVSKTRTITSVQKLCYFYKILTSTLIFYPLPPPNCCSLFLKVTNKCHLYYTLYDLQGLKDKNVTDVQDFQFVVPTLEYHNQTLTWLDLLITMKNDCKKALISQAIKQKLHMRSRVAELYELVQHGDNLREEDQKAKMLFGDSVVVSITTHSHEVNLSRILIIHISTKYYCHLHHNVLVNLPIYLTWYLCDTNFHWFDNHHVTMVKRGSHSF